MNIAEYGKQLELTNPHSDELRIKNERLLMADGLIVEKQQENKKAKAEIKNSNDLEHEHSNMALSIKC